jgi:hypothetical protein
VRAAGVLAIVIALAGPTAAGELLFANGSRLEGDLASEPLLVSTGSDLIEVLPETVGMLAPTEIRLKDGRVLRGTLVGGRVRARTALGELAITVDELRLFRADGAAPGAATPAPVSPPPPAVQATPVSTTASPRDAGLPPVTLYQPPAATAPEPAAAPAPTPVTAPAPPPARAPAVAAVAPGDEVARPATRPRLEVVVAESPLHRDALSGAPAVGRVVRGEQLTYVDAIDRRLWIFNTLIFDGGHWIKVRAANGTEGWVPATTVREVR